MLGLWDYILSCVSKERWFLVWLLCADRLHDDALPVSWYCCEVTILECRQEFEKFVKSLMTFSVLARVGQIFSFIFNICFGMMLWFNY
jgi:hypothetical protein